MRGKDDSYQDVNGYASHFLSCNRVPQYVNSPNSISSGATYSELRVADGYHDVAGHAYDEIKMISDVNPQITTGNVQDGYVTVKGAVYP